MKFFSQPISRDTFFSVPKDLGINHENSCNTLAMIAFGDLAHQTADSNLAFTGVFAAVSIFFALGAVLNTLEQPKDNLLIRR